MKIAKMAMKAVTISSVPPNVVFTRGGIREERRPHRRAKTSSTTKPPHHRRLSPHKSFRSEPVERRDIGIDLQVRRAFAGARDEQARPPAQDREHHDHGAEDRRVVAFFGGQPADDCPEQDGEERRGFDQRIAGGKLLAPR